jgi:hypothetical protein
MDPDIDTLINNLDKKPGGTDGFLNFKNIFVVLILLICIMFFLYLFTGSDTEIPPGDALSSAKSPLNSIPKASGLPFRPDVGTK